MKKILLSLAMIAVASAVAVGATQAYFSDTETSTGNTFTAGTLDLKVGNQDDPNIAFILENINPNQTKYQYWVLKNVGSVPGKPSIEFSVITNNENGCNEPEDIVDGTCGTPGAGEGDLGGNMYTMLKWRQGAGAWQSVRLTNNCGDPLLNGLSGLTVGQGLLTGCGTDMALPVLNQNDEVEVQFRGWIMSSIGNIIQGDSALFNVTFHLDQI